MCPVETQNFVSAENGAGFCSQAEKPEEAHLARMEPGCPCTVFTQGSVCS